MNEFNVIHAFNYGSMLVNMGLPIEEFIEKNISNAQLDFNYGLYCACTEGNAELIDLILAKGFKEKITISIPISYTKYKLKQTLKYTKMHELLIDMILNKI